MTYREKVFEKAKSPPSPPSLSRVGDYIEYVSFAVLAGAVLCFTALGFAIAINGATLAVAMPFLSAAGGLLLSFISLFLLAVIAEGGGAYLEYARQLKDDEEEEQSNGRRV